MLSTLSDSSSSSRPRFASGSAALAAFRAGLREHGHVEGDTLVITERYAAGQVARLPALAAELVRLQVDVLVTAPAGAALAAKQATNRVPIVFMGEPDPIGTGLVASLARPGGNVTGLADAHADLVPKRLALLRHFFRFSLVGSRETVATSAGLRGSRTLDRRHPF